MHNILVHTLKREQARVGETDYRTRGFIVGIEPPISVTQEIVDRVITMNSLEAQNGTKLSPFTAVTLAGSTEERTTFYARLFLETDQQGDIMDARGMLIERTTNLLGLLGVAGTVVDSIPKPVFGSLEL